MPNDDEVLDYCFAWQSAESADAPHKEGDEDADDVKGNRRFPHHLKKGGPANIPACRNGLARLEGSKIPDGDKAGVRAHLEAHIADFNKKSGDDSKDNAMPTEFWARAVQLGNMTDEDRVKVRAARVRKCSDDPEAFYRFTNSTGDVATLDIDNEIGFYGINASDFARDLDAVTADTLTVRINSGGGDVFDGIAITNLLRAHPATVNVVVMGLAASAASVIAQAGDKVTMMPNSQMMIHDASGVCMGNAAEMTAMAELLDKISDNLADAYAKRAGGTADEWRDVMRVEQWYTADEAVTAGLADEVAPVGKKQKPEEAAVENRWNLSFYNYDGRAEAPAPGASAQQDIQVHIDVPDEALSKAILNALRTYGLVKNEAPAEPAVDDEQDPDATEAEAATETPTDDTPDVVDEDEDSPTAAAATAATTDPAPEPVNTTTWTRDAFRAAMNAVNQRGRQQ